MIHKDAAIQEVRDLIAELENICELMEDEQYSDAASELEGQSGTIKTLTDQMDGWDGIENSTWSGEE